MRSTLPRSRAWHHLKKEGSLSLMLRDTLDKGNQDTCWIEDNQLFESLDPLIRLPLRVAALDEIDGVERAVDRAMSPEEEAGKRHHLAAAIGRERRDDQGHGQVQENPEPPTPGDEKKERNERDGESENYRVEPGKEHPLAKHPEKRNAQ